MKNIKKFELRKKVRCGIVGVVGRGSVYVKPMLECGYAEITAICDINYEGMLDYQKQIGNDVKLYTDYEEMINSGLVEMVVVATPIPLHVKQSVYALDRNVHVVCEVAAASTVEECRELYRAVKRSKAQYMLAENVNFFKDVIIVEKLIKAGYLGEPHYAESQYIHYCGVKSESEWRADELYAASYCTHNLGPMLKWFGNERIERICCVGSGRHAQTMEGTELRRERANVMLCKLESGRLLQVRVELDTPTPKLLPFEVSGTEGKILIRQSAPKEENYIHLQRADYEQTSYAEEWKSLQYYEREFLPESWLEATEKVPNLGHLRADYVIVYEFLRALAEGRKMPIDIDMALNMTLPGILSKESLDKGGAWIDIPRLDEESTNE